MKNKQDVINKWKPLIDGRLSDEPVPIELLLEPHESRHLQKIIELSDRPIMEEIMEDLIKCSPIEVAQYIYLMKQWGEFMNIKTESKVIEVKDRKLSDEVSHQLKNNFVDDIVVANPIDWELYLDNIKAEYEKDKLELSKEEFDKKYFGEWVVEDDAR